MELSAGAQLGPYQIEVPLGAGGMGRVYKARDTRLDRTVAIKVCRQEFSERFQREARAIAALNHPHICTLHDVGPDYLVMEYVEGKALTGPLPLDKVLEYGSQICDALEAAHRKGIVHRDLKPANVLVTRSGVKVLDFGLAKMAGQETVTAAGVVMGTPAYMAPEQWEGKEADARSDIYALGCVIHEMATGERVPRKTLEPAALDRVVNNCVAVDPEERWQSAREVKLALELARPAGPAPAEKPTKAGNWRWWLTATAACIGIVVAGFLVFRRPSQPQLPVRLSLTFEALTGVDMPVPSPDGRTLVFLASGAGGRRSLWIRSLDSPVARQLPGTEGAGGPFWSADAQWIGFGVERRIKKVNRNGGNPQTVSETLLTPGGNLWAAWNQAGDILFPPSNRSGLYHIKASGGQARPVTKLDPTRAENSHRDPSFLPDGRRFLFLSRTGSRQQFTAYLGSLDTAETRPLTGVQSTVRYVPPRDGRPAGLLYVRDGILVLHEFDGQALRGEPIRIADAHGFEVSSDGRVLVLSAANAELSQFTWFNRRGEPSGVLTAPIGYSQPRISPDGGWVLHERPAQETGTRDIWYIEISRGVPHRLTTDVANDWSAVWSPDARSIAFHTDRHGGPNHSLYMKNSLEPGAGETPLLVSRENDATTDWALNGNWLAFQRFKSSDTDLWILALAGERTPFAFLATPFHEYGARFSPDSKRIAYVSDESGRSEVYVRPFFGEPAAATGKIQVSTDGGDFPVWSRDGSELFFMTGDFKIYSVRTTDLARPGTVPRPAPLFTACPSPRLWQPMQGATWAHPYDVSPDGQRFLIRCDASGPGRFDVLLNWRR